MYIIELILIIVLILLIYYGCKCKHVVIPERAVEKPVDEPETDPLFAYTLDSADDGDYMVYDSGASMYSGTPVYSGTPQQDNQDCPSYDPETLKIINSCDWSIYNYMSDLDWAVKYEDLLSDGTGYRPSITTPPRYDTVENIYTPENNGASDTHLLFTYKTYIPPEYSLKPNGDVYFGPGSENGDATGDAIISISEVYDEIAKNNASNDGLL